ncbi:ABC transporter substrate-binding protein [Amycolatopsis albispora]|uniref:Iron transporter n=1 Tax=Amycolatopsis albispora TaxID=1804986 RepID=A0A344LJC7_9PSEU|nr:ABC transporter substrate-binding protein [Amycolatopsis albispora]AXB48151.1 iron transporter [Amycolatopsis albispora]
MKKRSRLLVLLALLPLVTACGATVEPAPAGEQAATATVTNCGEQVTYPTPQRAVSYDISGTEKMFALGLADRMRGYVLNKVADPSIDGSAYKADYAKVPRLGTARITREIVVDAQADWVFAGWNSGFSEERGITPKLLEQLGIRSYLHTETCWDYGTAKVAVSPLEALFTDLENLGKIFHVEARATELVGELRGRLDAVRQGAPAGAEPPRVFVYDSGTDQPFTAGKHAAPTDIIAAAGGRNVFGELADGWGSVGWEPVVQAQPEVIVVVDYGDQPAQAKIDFVKSFEGLKNSPAVRENRFHVMSIGELVSGPRNIAGAENLAGYLRSIGR